MKEERADRSKYDSLLWGPPRVGNRSMSGCDSASQALAPGMATKGRSTFRLAPCPLKSAADEVGQA
jgi:hypothetical protein